ncbi:MAG: curli production assembly protein CsgG, partial [Chryseobacterium sp.]|nr:curli production assembly protein CsgG [Chryseobacterium sp.]
PELNLEFLLFPKYRFSPYVYGGMGAMFSKYKPQYKGQVGGGLEYMIGNNTAIRASSQYDIGFKDDWEGLVNGKRKDQALRFALGINFYLGNQ